MTSAEELDTGLGGATTDEDERLSDLRQAMIDAAQDIIANLEEGQRRMAERQRLLFAAHQLLTVLGESDEPEESAIALGVAFPPPRPRPSMRRPLPPPPRAPMFGPPRPWFGPPPPWPGSPWWPNRRMPRRPPGMQFTD
jgi:hypothetical protein